MHSLSVLLVHFIDEDETRYLVLVSLPPHGHALGLCTEQTRLGSVSARDGNYEVRTYVGFFVLLVELCGSDNSQLCVCVFCFFCCVCVCVCACVHVHVYIILIMCGALPVHLLQRQTRLWLHLALVVIAPLQ